MQFFDLSQSFHLNDIFIPKMTLDNLSGQNWILAKIRTEHDCLQETSPLQGQVVLKSNQNIFIELSWKIEDTGHALHVLFKGIETQEQDETLILVQGATLLDENEDKISTQALMLWLDGTLLPMLPNLRQAVKTYLNLWDYVEYQD